LKDAVADRTSERNGYHGGWQEHQDRLCAVLGKMMRAVQRARYMTLEPIAPLSDDPIVKLPAVAT
jgi:hypothetical protein